jgi:peptidoglycan/xylan/chitin deacetylase (PgdA/CDA1 family)
MLRNADVLIHLGIHANSINTITDNSPDKVLVNVTRTPPHLYRELHQAVKTFPNKNVTVRYVSNPGYHAGATKVMLDGLDEGWFASYDWVIRLNPDTMIYDDSRLATAMNDKRYAVILGNAGSICSIFYRLFISIMFS